VLEYQRLAQVHAITRRAKLVKEKNFHKKHFSVAPGEFSDILLTVEGSLVR
jgi:hypothetical protein